MKIYFEELSLSTSKRIELVNITEQVEEVVERSGVKNGICLLYAPHATAAMVVNEDESGLKQDIVKWLEQTFPRNGAWKHNLIDDNASAHLASTFISPHKVLPIKDGRLVRGTWQSIFLVEMDGPRRRRVLIEVLGE
ncbi:MAG: secondary thiamine-phosphate synthase enzyme YjbQ [Candidatus Nezhaarchaeales archaeon]